VLKHPTPQPPLQKIFSLKFSKPLAARWPLDSTRLRCVQALLGLCSQKIGGLKPGALAALLKLALNADGDVCRALFMAVLDAGVRLATARHSSQVSQLLQSGALSSAAVCMCITQSSGIAPWIGLACAAVVTAMSIAMTLPAQPRRGKSTSIKAINSKRLRGVTCK
jgi:hypothetical protein